MKKTKTPPGFHGALAYLCNLPLIGKYRAKARKKQAGYDDKEKLRSFTGET